jgi:hypothetical protein
LEVVGFSCHNPADSLCSIHSKGAEQCHSREGQNVFGRENEKLWSTSIWRMYLVIYWKITLSWCESSSGETPGFMRSSERESYIMLGWLLLFAVGLKLT